MITDSEITKELSLLIMKLLTSRRFVSSPNIHCIAVSRLPRVQQPVHAAGRVGGAAGRRLPGGRLAAGGAPVSAGRSGRRLQDPRLVPTQPGHTCLHQRWLPELI